MTQGPLVKPSCRRERGRVTLVQRRALVLTERHLAMLLIGSRMTSR
jgi:hypothetical protein